MIYIEKNFCKMILIYQFPLRLFNFSRNLSKLNLFWSLSDNFK